MSENLSLIVKALGLYATEILPRSRGNISVAQVKEKRRRFASVLFIAFCPSLSILSFVPGHREYPLFQRVGQ